MIYFDNASTTKPNTNSLSIFEKASIDNFYNASSLYKAGVANKTMLDKYKQSILQALHASTQNNFVFTSGATEANNIIIRGVLRNKNAKLIFSCAEHSSIYNTAKELQNQGYNVVFIPITKSGIVDEAVFTKEVNDNTAFISIIHTNNETGAINDIKKLVTIAKAKNPKVIFHSDGVQAFGKIPVNIAHLNVDVYTISAHKVYGLKGIGGFYIKNNINLKPFIYGGGQQNNLRSGTENFAAISSFDYTVKDAVKNQSKNYNKVLDICNHFKSAIIKAIPNALLISDKNCSPYIVAISLPPVKSETLVYLLDEKGFLVGSGSACSSKSKNNRILSNMGYSADVVESSIRISFSKNNTKQEVDKLVTAILESVNEYKLKIKK